MLVKTYFFKKIESFYFLAGNCEKKCRLNLCLRLPFKIFSPLEIITPLANCNLTASLFFSFFWNLPLYDPL